MESEMGDGGGGRELSRRDEEMKIIIGWQIDSLI